jgi:hypothetical protein
MVWEACAGGGVQVCPADARPKTPDVFSCLTRSFPRQHNPEAFEQIEDFHGWLALTAGQPAQVCVERCVEACKKSSSATRLIKCGGRRLGNTNLLRRVWGFSAAQAQPYPFGVHGSCPFARSLRSLSILLATLSTAFQ